MYTWCQQRPPTDLNNYKRADYPNEPMIRTQIQVHAKQMKWLKKHALENDISMSQVIRDSIDFYRIYVERVRELHFKKKKALKAVGSFSTSNKE